VLLEFHLLKKVVLTSSVASVIWKDKSTKFNEDDWTDDEFCIRNNMPYQLSKVRAEREAWKIYAENEDKLDLVVLNPPLMFGPMLQPSLNTSSESLLDFLNGKKTKITNTYFGFVDVRDVAIAHLFAYEKNAKGRYLIIGFETHWEDICNVLRRFYPEGLIPTEIDINTPRVLKSFDVSKSLELGMSYRNKEETIRDTVESLKRYGFYNSNN